jgi:hypothetical protein
MEGESVDQTGWIMTAGLPRHHRSPPPGGVHRPMNVVAAP